MPQVANTIAVNIANRLETEYGITFTPTEQAQAEKIWRIVFEEYLAHFTANATFTIQLGDLLVDPGTFTAGVTPVTGEGKVKAATLTGKLS